MSMPDFLRIAKPQRTESARTEQLKDYATNLLALNKECYIAQVLLANPEMNMLDYTLCSQLKGDVVKIWLEKK